MAGVVRPEGQRTSSSVAVSEPSPNTASGRELCEGEASVVVKDGQPTRAAFCDEVGHPISIEVADPPRVRAVI